MTIADRERLASLFGYTKKWKDFDHHEGGHYILVNETGGWKPFDEYDPESNPPDLLALIEWTRKQEWFSFMEVFAGEVWIYWQGGQIKMAGPFNEAFPMAVLFALKELEK